MKIKLHRVKIRDVINGYVNNAEEGVLGYGGKLNIRPKYQREYVYNDKKRNAVIDSIRNDFPLNVMYWAKNEDGTLEMLDGQQRTISFCEYVAGNFSIDIDGNAMAFHNLTETDKNQILDYELMIYFCEGNDKEKLNWFKIINIAGVVFSDQELRNAVYTGPWLSDAKSKFSKTGCAAYQHASKYVGGSPIRQELLEKALKWISNGNIEKYMSAHQHDQNANELWIYFRNVIDWVKLTFVNYRKEMKNIDWHILYNEYKDKIFDTDLLEKEIANLMMDDDVTNKKGIYFYVLNQNEKYLNIRAFTDSQKREAFERQNGKCIKCGNQFELSEMDADHITPWSKGGKTISENCQMLCKECNRRKSNK